MESKKTFKEMILKNSISSSNKFYLLKEFHRIVYQKKKNTNIKKLRFEGKLLIII